MSYCINKCTIEHLLYVSHSPGTSLGFVSFTFLRILASAQICNENTRPKRPRLSRDSLQNQIS